MLSSGSAKAASIHITLKHPVYTVTIAMQINVAIIYWNKKSVKMNPNICVVKGKIKQTLTISHNG